MLDRWIRGRLDQVLHPAVEPCIGGKPDGIAVAFCFEKLVDPGLSEGRIASEELADCLVAITSDHRLQDQTPVVSAVDVPLP